MTKNPLREMRNQIVVLAFGLFFVCLIYRLSIRNQYVEYLPLSIAGQEEKWTEYIPENEDVLEMKEVTPHGDYVEVCLNPVKRGSSEAELRTEDGRSEALMLYRVSLFHTVYNRATGSFTGDDAFLMAVTAFCLLAGCIMLRCFMRLKGPGFYSYGAIYSAGFSLFAFGIGVTLLISTVRHLEDQAGYPIFSVLETVRGMGFHFMKLSAPFVVVFSAAMCISNIELLRHERPRLQNVLGILLSVLLIVGEVLGWWLNLRDFQGSEAGLIARETVQSVYTTVYVYFECILIGSIICNLIAARRKTAHDKDYCIILGCSFRRDGSLTPLLKGRVDRAIRFAREQEEETGKKVTLIPSGGQGENESMPEAEAMRRYLLSAGFPPEQILAETRSKNTYENMVFSKKIIEERGEGARVAYSTTNYHVFRSGVWAMQAGLKAEGIGSRTKWWFWPNAFVRECLGLFRNRWKQELFALLLIIGFFAAISVVMRV